MTPAQKAHKIKFAKMVKEAAILRKKNPKLTQPEAVKLAWANNKKIAGYIGTKKAVKKKADPVKKSAPVKNTENRPITRNFPLSLLFALSKEALELIKDRSELLNNIKFRQIPEMMQEAKLLKGQDKAKKLASIKFAKEYMSTLKKNIAMYKKHI
jgi:hypothetical protein